MKTAIDHIVIGAATLEQGAEYIKRILGVDMPFGGEHLTMGTHNLLIPLGENIFLEVIAINPDIPSPSQPRWYGLDDPYVRKCLAIEPALLTWVVNTGNIRTLMKGAGVSFGKPELISRDNLSWYFGLPGDGRLLAGGLLPYLIEWQTEAHPANSMKDSGCRLHQMRIFHTNVSWLESKLTSIDASHCVEINSLNENSAAFMIAEIETPYGIKELRSIAAESQAI